MTVALREIRQTVVLSYDQEKVKGDSIHVTCTNPDDLSDISNPPDSDNDGEVNVTVPDGYSGSFNVTVEGSAGGDDAGEITV